MEVEGLTRDVARANGQGIPTEYRSGVGWGSLRSVLRLDMGLAGTVPDCPVVTGGGRVRLPGTGFG
jgi:hypothetical protein